MYLTIDSLFEQAVFLVINLISSLAFPAAMGKPANSNIGKSFLLSPAAIISLLLAPINSPSFESAEPFDTFSAVISILLVIEVVKIILSKCFNFSKQFFLSSEFLKNTFNNSVLSNKSTALDKSSIPILVLSITSI